MDLMKEVFGSAEPKTEPKVEPKPAPKVELNPEPKVEPNPEPKVDPKPEPETKAQAVDNEKLQRLEQELKQSEHDYMDSVQEVMHAYSFYDQMKRGYDRDPESSSLKAVTDASDVLEACRSRQSEIDRRRKSLKKQIAELKGGANSQ